MGIGGLTTYIERNGEVFFESYRLHNCCLVIDGNSVASQIYVREFSDGKRGRCAFGGDYDEYARAVKRFFERLTICSVRAIVVLDGGKEPRKGKTHWTRLRGKISAGVKASPSNCSQVNLPLLLVPVFQWIAIQSKAIVAQCCFEADEEVAALSRALSCPLLSYDSDFFLHNVPFYIPFPTLSQRLTQEQPDPDRHDRKQLDRYITCKVFNAYNFMNRNNICWNRKNDGEKRSLHPELLPLIAVLLGNDYVKKKTFSCFMSQIQLPRKCTKSARIVGLLEWLRSQESLESAIYKILNHTKKGKRVYLEQIIKKTIDVYVGGESELYHTLNLSSILGKIHEAPASATYKIQQDSIIENMENLEHHSVEAEDFVDVEENDCDNEYTDSENSDSQSSSSDENFSENELEVCLNDKLKQLPSWFLERYKRCELPPSFMDIMVRRVYLCSPQIEDASQPQSHQISFPILQAILRLLTPENDEPLICWTRVGSKAGILSLDPLPRQDTWPLMENLLQTPRNKLVDVIMQALQLCSDDKNENKERKSGFNSLPSDWRLLALSLAYWMRYSPGKKVNERHLIAACFTAVVLRVIDERAGPPGKSYSNIRKEKKRQYTDLKKQQRNKEVEDLIKSEQQHSQPVTHDDLNSIQSKYEEIKDVSEVKEKNVKPSVKQLLSSISLGDCIAVSDSEGLISQMRQIDAGPKRRLALRPSSFSGSTVHAFAELQSVLLHVTHLNLLLGEPIAPSPLHSSFSGTLAYNAHYRAHSRSTASRKQIWRNLLGIPAPSLESLLEEFYLCVLRLAWGKVEDKMIKKKKRVKKKVRNKMADAGAPKESYFEDSENQKIYYDPGNKYSLLNQIG